jgi:hypothetical protein
MGYNEGVDNGVKSGRPRTWGRKVSTGKGTAENARRGAAGLVKSGKAITGNTNMKTAQNMVEKAFATSPALAVA